MLYKAFCCLLFAIISEVYFSAPVYAESIVFKSGKTAEGKIIDKTENYIAVDSQGSVMTYLLEDIASIDGNPASSYPAKSPQNVIMLSKEEIVKTMENESNDAIQKDPGSAEANYQKGMALRMRDQAGDLEDSISYFSKAVELDPQNPRYYKDRNVSYSMLGKIDEAMADIDKAIELSPDDAESYFFRAIVYFYKKEYDKSWEDVHKAEALGAPVDPDFLSELKKASGI